VIAHYHQTIPGWFNFAALYREQVERIDSGHFVEVGSWFGRSTVFMAVEIANSGKTILFDAVDTWDGGTDQLLLRQIAERGEDEIYREFFANITPVRDYVTPIRLPSVQAAKRYEDHSLDFVYLDASHDYESVRADIEAWTPKVKPGGVIAGHDYKNSMREHVCRAVDEAFGPRMLGLVSQSSWKVTL